MVVGDGILVPVAVLVRLGVAMALASRYPVILDGVERAQVQQLARSRAAPHRRVVRARILLAAADGASNAAIARAEGVHVDTVRERRRRYVTEGLAAALDDRPRPGRPRRYGPEARLRIIAAVTSAAPEADSVWTHRLLARSLSDLAISASQIGRILADCDLKPHRVRGWLTRPADPDFFVKAAGVCAAYRTTAPDAVVLSVDEKTGIGARSRKHPEIRERPGRRARREFEYVRHGTVSIIAALNVRTGQVVTETIAKNNSATFVRFLALLDQTIDPGLQIHLVLDNGSSHTAKNTKAWLARHPRFHVHWTPKHASWLNQVELWFSTLTRRLLRRGDFTSRQDLIDKIDAFVEYYDDHDAKPYRWTYDGTPLKAA
jgi:transposase